MVLCLFNDRDRNPALLCDYSHRFRKATAFDSHDEIKDASTRAAAETFEEPFARMNSERRSLLRVKRTAGQVVRAALLEAHVVGYDPDYVTLVLNVVGKASRQTHRLIQSLIRNFEGAAGSTELENF
jgi:hypothetical protein